MSVFRRITSVGQRKPSMPMLAAVMLAGYMAVSPAHSATFGHSRLVSAAGEPLRITIPVIQLSAAEAESLRVVPAPASAWVNAGLTPPVDAATLQSRLADGYTPGSRVIQVWSDQVFNQPIADLLLDIHTSSGVQRYQVSLLARGGATAVQAPMSSAASVAAPARAAGQQPDIISLPPVLVRRGDTMFSVAQRHAVSGVTVYQMMMALQRANPQAFIHQNVNLVKAGERLVMPDMDALTAISDREARRLFHEQVVAFNAYRQGQGDLIASDVTAAQSAAPVDSSLPEFDGISNIPESRVAGGDQLKLSSGHAGGIADIATESGGNVSQATTPAQQQPASTSAGNSVGTNESSSAANSVGTNESSLAQNMATGVSKPAQAATTEHTSSSASNGNATSAATAQSSLTNPANGALPHTTESSAVTGADAGASSTSAVTDGSEADDAVAARKAIEDAEMRVSILEENVKNLNRALQSQGEAAIDVVVDGAIGLRQSLTDVATAVTDATIGDDDFLDDAASGQDQAVSASTAAPQDNATKSMMESITTWVHANFIGVIVAVLALIVLIIAWVLRRANLAHSRSDNAITPEMVKEKLDEINLELNEPTVTDSSRRG